MGTTTITLSWIASFLLVVLFIYFLYLFGGLTQHVKRILEIVEKQEKKGVRKKK